MIKTKQPKNAWAGKGTKLRGKIEKLCLRREIVKYNNHGEKKSAFAGWLTSFIYKNFEFKSTYNYNQKLQNFFQTIISRANSVTKLAQKKVTL